MPVQISCSYQRSDDPGYLVVVNGSTPNFAIRQTLGFLRHRLRMKVDVFNLSVYGSYDIRDASGDSVLSQYRGKSIIIFGNEYSHPGVGLKRPWDLIDAYAVTALLKKGTYLHFPNVPEAALPSLQAWPTEWFSLFTGWALIGLSVSGTPRLSPPSFEVPMYSWWFRTSCQSRSPLSTYLEVSNLRCTVGPSRLPR